MTAPMELIDFSVYEEERMEASFLCQEETTRYTIRLSFRNRWRHMPFEGSRFNLFVNEAHQERAKKLLEGFTILAMPSSGSSEEAKAGLEARQQSVFCHFPDEMVRKIFVLTMQSWALRVRCPLSVSLAPSSGYPMIAVHFYSLAINKTEVENIILQIVQAIAHMEIEPYHESEFVQEAAVGEEELENAEAFEEEYEEEIQERLKDIALKNHVESVFENAEVVLSEPSPETLEGSFLSAPPLKHMYAIRREEKLREVVKQYPEAFAAIPEEWIHNHLNNPAVWCMPTMASAVRFLLGSYAAKFSDEEILKYHANSERFVKTISTAGTFVVDTHSRLGTLLVLPEKAVES